MEQKLTHDEWERAYDEVCEANAALRRERDEARATNRRLREARATHEELLRDALNIVANYRSIGAKFSEIGEHVVTHWQAAVQAALADAPSPEDQ